MSMSIEHRWNYKCDRCHVTFTLSFNPKNQKELDFAKRFTAPTGWDNVHRNRHLCKDCVEKLNSFMEKKD